MTSNQSGFFKIISVVILILIVIVWLKIDVRGLVESESGQAIISILAKIWSVLHEVWVNYLEKITLWIWTKVLLPIIQLGISLIHK